MCTRIKLTSPRDATEDFRIPNFGQLFRAQTEEDWGHEICGVVIGYAHNALDDNIFGELENRLLYHHELFRSPPSVESVGLDRNVEYTNSNQGIMPESHNIWVQYMDSDLNNTSQGRVPSFPVLYHSLTAQIHILQFQERLHIRKISTFSKRCKKTQQSTLHPQAQEYVVVIPPNYEHPHSGADCVDGFIRGFKQTNQMHIVHVGAIVGSAHLVQENAASDRIYSIWLVNNHVNLDTRWTIY